MKLLTVRDTARKLGVSLGCVYGLVAKGELAHLRIGTGRGTIRIDENDLGDFIDGRKVGKPTRRRRTSPSPTAFTNLDGARLREAWRDQGVR